jgi:hypothetical protein
MKSEITACSHPLKQLQIGSRDESTFSRAEHFGGMHANHIGDSCRLCRIKTGSGVHDGWNARLVLERLPRVDVHRCAKRRHNDHCANRP